MTTKSSRYWMILVGAVLMIVLTAIIYLEIHQRSLLSQTLGYDEENVSWHAYQLDRSFQRLQITLQRAVMDFRSVDPDELQLRLDVFLNQIATLSKVYGAHTLPRYEDGQAAFSQIFAFTDRFERYLGDNGASQLTPGSIREMLQHMDELVMPVHELALAGNEIMIERANKRAEEIRHEIAISTVLALFQFLLALLFSYIVLRQMRQLRGHATELAQALSAADRNYAELSSYMRAIDQHAMVTVTAMGGGILHANEKFCCVTGYSGEELRNQMPAFYSSSMHPDEFSESLVRTIMRGEIWRGEVCSMTKDGDLFWADATFVPIRNADGKIDRYLSVMADITEKKYADERIAYQSIYDELSGLPNRQLLLDRMQQALARDRRARDRTAILLVDLDQFKSVNDLLGGEVGDLLLKEVAIRLKSYLRDTDTVARLQGDEFAILLPGIGSMENADAVAKKTLDTLRLPFDLNGSKLTITASIGAAVYPEGGADPETLLRNSDIAMHHAKAHGRNQCRFFSNPDHSSDERALKSSEPPMKTARHFSNTP